MAGSSPGQDPRPPRGDGRACAPARPVAGCLGSRRRRGAPRTVAPPTIAREQALSRPAAAESGQGATPESGLARLGPSCNALSFVSAWAGTGRRSGRPANGVNVARADASRRLLGTLAPARSARDVPATAALPNSTERGRLSRWHASSSGRFSNSRRRLATAPGERRPSTTGARRARRKRARPAAGRRTAATLPHHIEACGNNRKE